MKSITEAQEEIIEEFSLLDADFEMTINYIMELGEQLEEFPEEYRDEEHIVKGCQSKVWMNAKLNDDSKIVFSADSNTAITKGLASLLVRVFSNQSPETIQEAEIYFPEKIGMQRFIGTQRSNGFGSMIKQMKYYALALGSLVK